MTVTARETEPWVFVTLTGFNTPGTVGRYDLQQPEELRWSIYRTAKVKGLNPDEFESLQVTLAIFCRGSSGADNF